MSKSFKEDLTGKRFGRLTVLEFVPTEDCYSHWKCRCGCGKIKTVFNQSLKSGSTKSCGCLSLEVATELGKNNNPNKKHGLRNTRLYNVWCGMKSRCYNCKNMGYKNYGGRGIAVCDEWKNDFKKFYDWAMTNGYKEGLSIDRIDTDKDYRPENCRWVSMKEQQWNKRNNILIEHEGKMITLVEIAEQLGVPRNTIDKRYFKGDRGDKLFRPVKKRQ